VDLLNDKFTLKEHPIQKETVVEPELTLHKYNPENPQIFYQHPNGNLWVGNSIKWLQTLESNSVDLVFADPPYNIKKAEWDIFESQQAYVDWSLQWIKQASRILKPSGSLYVFGFSEILADIKLPALNFFRGCKWLVWHYKNKANLSKDWGRSHESILHFRKSKNFKLDIENIRIPYSEHTLKYPEHPQAKTSQYRNSGKPGTACAKSDRNDNRIWHPHPKGAKPRDVIEIPTTCNGMNEKTKHPTQKPEELVRKFVLSSSSRGDLIVDPFIGSGTTLVVAEQLGRRWLGCEINLEYASWAVERIKGVKYMTDEEWFWFDRYNEERRKKIR
jgi:site-specific DNA-methyltransferase (adenine-specific)